MKKTKLYETHKSLGAKITSFAGYEMPISYGSIMNEHNCVRNSLGIFDVSHMGEFLVEGENAENFLQYCCSNDIKKLFIGRAQYNYFPNLNSGIIDDLIVNTSPYSFLRVASSEIMSSAGAINES